MAPLIVLVTSYIVLWICTRFFRVLGINRAGRTAFALMLVFTGVSHFYMTKGMVMSIPDLPAKELLVYITGINEVALGFLFVLGKELRLVSIMIIVFLIAIFPANIYAAIEHVDIAKATYDGQGMSYLLFRAPLQLFFIIWVYLFGIKRYGAGSPKLSGRKPNMKG